MLKQIDPTKLSISHYAKLMAQLHFELHNIEIKMNSNLKTELTNKINTAEVIKEYEKQIVINVLNTLPGGNALCHYDFHPGNIILSSKGPIIIDWMNVLVGNQAADVTRTSMMIQSHALPSNAPGWLIKREYREFFNREYLREYLMLSGMNPNFLEEWMAPTLAARVCEVNGEDRNEVIDKLQIIIKN
nr:phosphotransferase [Paenibacillus polymyxa]